VVLTFVMWYVDEERRERVAGLLNHFLSFVECLGGVESTGHHRTLLLLSRHSVTLQ
jgi:hypothetical protein